MKQRSAGLLILVLSIAAGLAAAVMSIGLIQGKTRTVYVAKDDVPAFTALDSSMFEMDTKRVDQVNDDVITDLNEVSGRYAKALLIKGTLIRKGHLASSTGDVGSLAAKLTETGTLNARALAIPVDNSTGVGGTIQAGDHVDAVATVKLDQQQKAGQFSFSKVIARGLPVLYRTQVDRNDSTAKSTVVVQVTLEQAEDITFALNNGTVYLMTTPYKTADPTEKTTGTTADSFVQRYIGR